MSRQKQLNLKALSEVEAELQTSFDKIFSLQIQIKQKLAKYSDEKVLKGYELVGWLGEIYVKLLFRGRLVADIHEHDVETDCGMRISVKTRRGSAAGWRTSSAIPKFEGEGCPSHLAFVHLHNNYSLDRIWFYDWRRLCSENRFTPKYVRNEFRSYIFKLDEKRDADCLIFSRR